VSVTTLAHTKRRTMWRLDVWGSELCSGSVIDQLYVGIGKIIESLREEGRLLARNKPLVLSLLLRYRVF
jgi:hypothetical protein